MSQVRNEPATVVSNTREPVALYRELALLVDARKRCLAWPAVWPKGNEIEVAVEHVAADIVRRTQNPLAERTYTGMLRTLIAAWMPSGSGVDDGVGLDLDQSTGQRLVFNTSFHHMDQNGMYDGWTEHEVIVTADLLFEIDVRVTGRNRNEIKDYLGQLFSDALQQKVVL